MMDTLSKALEQEVLRSNREKREEYPDKDELIMAMKSLLLVLLRGNFSNTSSEGSVTSIVPSP
jgi:hypothetical protein